MHSAENDVPGEKCHRCQLDVRTLTHRLCCPEARRALSPEPLRLCQYLALDASVCPHEGCKTRVIPPAVTEDGTQ